MSKEGSLLYLRHQLRVVNAGLHEAEQALHEDNFADRVHAAGELARLERRRDEVDRKIARVEADSDSLWTRLKDEIIIDLDAISHSVQHFMQRH